MATCAPESAMRNLIAGYWVSRLIYVAARLGIADLLSKGPRTAKSMASAAGEMNCTLPLR